MQREWIKVTDAEPPRDGRQFEMVIQVIATGDQSYYPGVYWADWGKGKGMWNTPFGLSWTDAWFNDGPARITHWRFPDLPEPVVL